MNRYVPPIDYCLCPTSDVLRIVKVRLKMMNEGKIDASNQQRLFKDFVKMETRRRMTCTCEHDNEYRHG